MPETNFAVHQRHMISLFSLGSFIAAASHAETVHHIDELTCTYSDSTTVTEAVYAFSFDAALSNNPNYFSVYVAGSRFNYWFGSEFFNFGIYHCSFSGISGTTVYNVIIVNVNATGVGANVDAGFTTANSLGQRYTEVTFKGSKSAVGFARKAGTDFSRGQSPGLSASEKVNWAVIAGTEFHPPQRGAPPRWRFRGREPGGSLVEPGAVDRERPDEATAK